MKLVIHPNTAVCLYNIYDTTGKWIFSADINDVSITEMIHNMLPTESINVSSTVTTYTVIGDKVTTLLMVYIQQLKNKLS